MSLIRPTAPQTTLETSKRPQRYVLRLYVAGIAPRVGRTVESVRAVCLEHLDGRFDLQVIDVYQQPALAKGDQIIAMPTLVKTLPLPVRRIIGDMSDRDRLLVDLGLAGHAIR